MTAIEEYGKLVMPVLALVLALISRGITPAKPGGRGFTTISKLLVVCVVILGIVVAGSGNNSTSQFAAGVGLMGLLWFAVQYAIAETIVFAVWRKPLPDPDSD